MSLGKIGIGAIIVGGLIFGAFSIEGIKPGYVGVVYNVSGGVQKEVLGQGWHFVAPWKKVTEYSVATEQAYLSQDEREGSETDESFLIPTKDGKTVNVDLEFSYHFDPDMLATTFTTFRGQDGKEIEQRFIRGKIKAYAGEVSSKYAVIDIFGEKRSDLNKAVYMHVKSKFEPYGIIIDSVNFPRIGLDAQTEQAIQQRVNSQQQLEQAKIDKEKAMILADKLKVEAQGQADAKLIEAKGEALANKEKTKSISKELVDYEKWKNWNGVLPQVMGGDTITDVR